MSTDAKDKRLERQASVGKDKGVVKDLFVVKAQLGDRKMSTSLSGSGASSLCIMKVCPNSKQSVRLPVKQL